VSLTNEDRKFFLKETPEVPSLPREKFLVLGSLLSFLERCCKEDSPLHVACGESCGEIMRFYTFCSIFLDSRNFWNEAGSCL
jgi:hypothetical protein